MSRKLLLAGASALAMLVATGAADATTYAIPGMYSFTVAATGEYSIDVFGASGGDSLVSFKPGGVLGGRGAEVSGDAKLFSGDVLTLYIGGRGGTGPIGGGGGGGSFLFRDGQLLAAAGGGGGAAYLQAGLPGLASYHGGAGAGTGGGAGGAGGNYAKGGSGGSFSLGFNGGGGAGFVSGALGNGGDGSGGYSGFGAKFPNGGNGSAAPPGGEPVGGGGEGGFGGGGGGGGGGGQSHSGSGGGGGGGYTGGGGGSGKKAVPSEAYGGYAGGGGGSYLEAAGNITNENLISGVNVGDGRITFALVGGTTPAVPEPSTWAMTLAGFAGLGWLATRRARKSKSA